MYVFSKNAHFTTFKTIQTTPILLWNNLLPDVKKCSRPSFDQWPGTASTGGLTRGVLMSFVHIVFTQFSNSIL